MSDNCIFCKIITGEIPCYNIYEDDDCLAFLDVNPIARGHTLVVPKKHAVDIFEIEEEKLQKVIVAVKKVAQKLEKNLGAQGVNILNANRKEAQQSVFHLHFHVVPRQENDSLDTWPESDYKEDDFESVIDKLKN